MIISLLNCQLYTLYYLGLAEADENCKRFMDRALPECFKKVCVTCNCILYKSTNVNNNNNNNNLVFVYR